jgi:hypothetical protein
MATRNPKLKNQTLTLPKEWKGKEIFVRKYNDTIIVKRVQEPEFWTSWEKIKPFSKDISKKDIEKAVKSARKSSKS